MADPISIIAENKIRNAYAEGVFDQLPGKGKPITWEENPFESDVQRIAHYLLKTNDMKPDWLELQAEITREWEAAKQMFGNAAFIPSQEVKNGTIEHPPFEFRLRVEAINKKIRTFNLLVPLAQMQRKLIDPCRVWNKWKTSPQEHQIGV